MSFITVNSTGAGYAYVDMPVVEEGDRFTLYAYPYEGESIEDITATDSHGFAIAIAPFGPVRYYEVWGDVTINVEFSGSTPPTPTLHEWLIAVLKKISERS